MTPFYQPGKYLGRYVKHDLGVTSNNNVQLVVEFQIFGRPNPKDASQFYEEKVQLMRRVYRVINENTMEWAMADLKSLGFQGDSIEQLKPDHPKAWNFGDVEVDLFCNHEKDQKGEMREVWGIARTGGALVQQSAGPDQIRKLDVLFRKNLAFLKDGAKPAPVASPKPSQRGGTMIDDDDVPFG